MTEAMPAGPSRSLFAHKGEAVPSPAVAYVSLRQMRGEAEQRAEEPDRRAQQRDACEHEVASDDGRDRRGPDYGGRRHFTPPTGLAFGQQFVPWAATDADSDASQETTAKPRAKQQARSSLSVSSLSSLIQRHGVAPPSPPSAMLEAQTPPAEAATRVDVEKDLSTPETRGQAPTSSEPVASRPEPAPAAPQQPEARLAAAPTKIDRERLTAADIRLNERLKEEVAGVEIDKIDADQRVVGDPAAQSSRDRAPDLRVVAGPATTTSLSQRRSSILTTSCTGSTDVGDELVNDRTEEIKRRATEMATEMAEIEEDMHSVIFDLGIQNLVTFRKKVDAAGIARILQETPQIEVHDHDHAYGFRLDKMEYAVFADWDTGKLCRDVTLGEGTRQPRITDFDHNDALNEMVDCLIRMLATIERGGTL